MLKYDATDVYAICNNEKWCTSGNSKQYEKIMELADSGEDIKILALTIWLCTPDKEREEIKQTILCNCSCCDEPMCAQRNTYRRLPKSSGGLGLCPNLR